MSRYHPRCPTDKETAAASRTPRWTAYRNCAIIVLMETRCAQCGAAMTCHQEAGCWCAELPHLPMPADDEGCLCRNCLLAKIEALQKSGESKEA
jgi:hypothetical protein